MPRHLRNQSQMILRFLKIILYAILLIAMFVYHYQCDGRMVRLVLVQRSIRSGYFNFTLGF